MEAFGSSMRAYANNRNPPNPHRYLPPSRLPNGPFKAMTELNQKQHAKNPVYICADVKPRLTKEQHNILEAYFQQQHKPSTSTKKVFAKSLGVPVDKINNWFQNRRAKVKLNMKKQMSQFNINMNMYVTNNSLPIVTSQFGHQNEQGHPQQTDNSLNTFQFNAQQSYTRITHDEEPYERKLELELLKSQKERDEEAARIKHEKELYARSTAPTTKNSRASSIRRPSINGAVKVLCIKYTISEDMTKGERARNKARLSAITDRPRILGSKRSSVLGFAHGRTSIEAHSNNAALVLKDRSDFFVSSRPARSPGMGNQVSSSLGASVRDNYMASTPGLHRHTLSPYSHAESISRAPYSSLPEDL